MENQRQKWANLVFLAVSILVAVVAFIGLEKIVAVYNVESTIKQIDLVVRLGSLVLGVVTGLILYFNDKSNAFMNEVVLELMRVTWPAPKDTVNATVWVILFVLIAGAILGGFDSFWTWVMKLVL